MFEIVTIVLIQHVVLFINLLMISRQQIYNTLDYRTSVLRNNSIYLIPLVYQTAGIKSMGRGLFKGIVIALIFLATILVVVPKPRDFSQLAKVNAQNDEAESFESEELCLTCSWRIYLENVEWKRTHPLKDLSIDDDYAVHVTYPDPELACQPKLFGYSDGKAAEVFPELAYKHCSTKVSEPRHALKIDTKKNLLTLNCTGEFPGKFVLGKGSFNETYSSNFKQKARLYTGPVNLTDEEWALGTCDPDAVNFEQADYQHRHKPEVLKRAKELMKKQIKSKNLRGMFGFDPPRQAILMLTVDSASRRQFYRKLPKTVAFLNALQKSYSVTDFKLHNVIGDNSVFNQIPLFTGTQIIHKRRQGNSFFKGDALQSKSLYRYLKDKGYVTLLGLEFCHHYFIEYLGDKPDFDHLMGNFWCGAMKYSGYHFEKMSSGLRCIGAEFSHSYLLNYLLQFTSSYAEVNQFIYAHITTGHESTGQQLQTLDDDLVQFLEAYFALTSSLGIEAAIFLQGDHGMRYGAWYTEDAAFQEHRLPAFFLILSQSIVDRLPSAHDILAHNSERLVSKLDMHLTIKVLSIAAYTAKVNRFSTAYSWKSSDKWLSTSVSLITEKISNNRTCGSIHIPAYWCSCNAMTQLELTKPAVQSIVDKLTDYTLATMNSRTQTAKLVYGASLCQKLTLKEVMSVDVTALTLQDEAFQIEFSVNEQSARFQVYLVIGKRKAYFRMKQDTEDAYEPAPFNYQGAKMQVRLMFAKRLDSYSGVCEMMAREVSLDPSLCVCNSMSLIKEKQPILLSQISWNFQPVVSETEGLTCEVVCRESGFECSPQYFAFLVDCASVASLVKPVTSCMKGDRLQARAGTQGFEVTMADGDCQVKADYLAICACKVT